MSQVFDNCNKVHVWGNSETQGLVFLHPDTVETMKEFPEYWKDYYYVGDFILSEGKWVFVPQS